MPSIRVSKQSKKKKDIHAIERPLPMSLTPRYRSLPVLLRLALEELRHQGPRPQVRVVDRAVREPRVHGAHVGLRHGIRLRGEPRQEHRPALG